MSQYSLKLSDIYTEWMCQTIKPGLKPHSIKRKYSKCHFPKILPLGSPIKLKDKKWTNHQNTLSVHLVLVLTVQGVLIMCHFKIPFTKIKFSIRVAHVVQIEDKCTKSSIYSIFVSLFCSRLFLHVFNIGYGTLGW